jgi:hypothetical protein
MIPEWIHSIDNSAEFWGLVGGFAATLLKQLETQKHPFTAPSTTETVYKLQYVWNPLLGFLLTHLYVKSGSSLTLLTAFITGGSAPIILKQLLASTVPQHLPGTKDTEKPPRGRRRD